MSETYGLAGTTPVARKPLVQLEKPYRKLIREAIMAAISNTIAEIYQLLIASAYSPVPKDTGFLRAHLVVDMKPSAEGVSLILAWPDVPYAHHLIAKAGQVQVRHTESTPSPRGGVRYDPMAENPWMEPSMRMVFPLVLAAFQRELELRGIEFTRG